MKKILFIILAVLCHAAFISCWEIEDVDFPKRVRIPQKGGVVTIETESHIYGLSLKGRDDFDIAFDDRTGEMARDSDSITLRWLTLIHTKKGIHRCYFKASENNTGKKRGFTLSGMVYNTPFDAIIEQDK